MIYSQEEIDDVLRWIGKKASWFAENDHIERRNYAISRLARTLIQDAILAELKMPSVFYSPMSDVFVVSVQDPMNLDWVIEERNGCQNMAWLGVAVKYRAESKRVVNH